MRPLLAGTTFPSVNPSPPAVAARADHILKPAIKKGHHAKNVIRGLFFWRKKVAPYFFSSSEIRLILVETNFTLGPISKSILVIILLFFDTGLLSPRIWDVRATFKAVLTAVDMK